MEEPSNPQPQRRDQELESMLDELLGEDLSPAPAPAQAPPASVPQQPAPEPTPAPSNDPAQLPLVTEAVGTTAPQAPSSDPPAPATPAPATPPLASEEQAPLLESMERTSAIRLEVPESSPEVTQPAPPSPVDPAQEEAPSLEPAPEQTSPTSIPKEPRRMEKDGGNFPPMRAGPVAMTADLSQIGDATRPFVVGAIPGGSETSLQAEEKPAFVAKKNTHELRVAGPDPAPVAQAQSISPQPKQSKGPAAPSRPLEAPSAHPPSRNPLSPPARRTQQKRPATTQGFQRAQTQPQPKASSDPYSNQERSQRRNSRKTKSSGKLKTVLLLLSALALAAGSGWLWWQAHQKYQRLSASDSQEAAIPELDDGTATPKQVKLTPELAGGGPDELVGPTEIDTNPTNEPSKPKPSPAAPSLPDARDPIRDDEALTALRQILEATSFEEFKRQWLITENGTGPREEDYTWVKSLRVDGFGNPKLSPDDLARGFYAYLGPPSTVKDLDEQKLISAGLNQGSLSPRSLLVLRRQAEGAIHADWHVFHESATSEFPRFVVDAVEAEARNFRVGILRSDASPRGLLDFYIAAPMVAPVSSGVKFQIQADSTLGKALQDEMDADERKSATVALRWVKSSDGKASRLELVRFVCWEFLGLAETEELKIDCAGTFAGLPDAK